MKEKLAIRLEIGTLGKKRQKAHEGVSLFCSDHALASQNYYLEMLNPFFILEFIVMDFGKKMQIFKCFGKISDNFRIDKFCDEHLIRFCNWNYNQHKCFWLKIIKKKQI